VRKLLSEDYNPETGFTLRYYWDSADEKVIVQHLQDVEDQLDVNQREYNTHGDYRRFGKGYMHKMASVPMSVYEMWRKDGFDLLSPDTDDKAIRRRLNDRAYSKFRTMPGKL